jgi:hypothetical protein
MLKAGMLKPTASKEIMSLRIPPPQVFGAASMGRHDKACKPVAARNNRFVRCGFPAIGTNIPRRWSNL